MKELGGGAYNKENVLWPYFKNITYFHLKHLRWLILLLSSQKNFKNDWTIKYGLILKIF